MFIEVTTRSAGSALACHRFSPIHLASGSGKLVAHLLSLGSSALLSQVELGFGFGVRAWDHRRPSSVNKQALRNQFVEEAPVVRNEQTDATMCLQRTEQDFPRLAIEMVRRLVERHNRRIKGKRTGNLYAFALAMRKGAVTPQPIVFEFERSAEANCLG